MNEILNKIKGDFFSIMAPGFYLLVVLVIFMSSLFGKMNCEYLKNIIIPNLSTESIKLNDYWPLYLLVVFISYLFGEFLKAIPVKNAENICKKIFYIKPYIAMMSLKGLDNIYYTKDFPYHDALKSILNSLQENGYSKDVFSLPESGLHTFYNFMKAVLCSQSPNAFVYTQVYEYRVRLFSGMFWSSLFGIFFCIINGIFLLFISKAVWTPIHTGLIISSIIICILLGGQLPRVRGQEVEYVFLSYLSNISKNYGDKK